MAATMASTIQYTLARPCTYWPAARSSVDGLSFIFEEGSKSKFTYSPKLDLLSKLQTPSGSISAGCRRAAGGWCVFLQLGAGPGLHCNLGKMKWYLLSVIVPPLPGHGVQHWQLHQPSIPDVFSVSTAQSTLTLFTIARLDIWCRYYIVHISTRLLLQPEPE